MYTAKLIRPKLNTSVPKQSLCILSMDTGEKSHSVCTMNASRGRLLLVLGIAAVGIVYIHFYTSSIVVSSLRVHNSNFAVYTGHPTGVSHPTRMNVSGGLIAFPDNFSLPHPQPMSSQRAPGTLARSTVPVKVVVKPRISHSLMNTFTSSSPALVTTARGENELKNEKRPQLPVRNLSLQSMDFTIREDFTFPHPIDFQEVEKVLQSDWVQQLKSFLRSIYPSQTVTITVATESFIPNLLNWLISASLVADPPLDYVITVAFDKPVYLLLRDKNLPVILVPFKSVLKGKRKGVSKVWMARFAVIRLLNHWGYDVQQFDTDAIILRNPKPLYDKYPDTEIVSARGKLPFELGKGPWGFTICMGAVLLRSTGRMEQLWKTMHSRKMEETRDDQKRINFALKKSKLIWKSTKLTLLQENSGTTSSGLKVVVLPPVYICRVLCTQNSTTDYYVWHQPGGGHSASWKVKHDSISHVWFLRSNWKSTTMGKTQEVNGREWLRAISDPVAIEHARDHQHNTIIKKHH